MASTIRYNTISKISNIHIHPKWVLAENELRDVSEFDRQKQKNIPKAYCTVCQEEVVLKLGRKYAKHYAHKPNSKCVIRRGETALHLNTKMHIYMQMLNGTTVTIKKNCTGSCSANKTITWVTNWDHVEVEYSVDSIRPDIALLKKGKVIGAVEIFNTHRVNEIKEKKLNKLKLPWIEIRATEDLYIGENYWTHQKPLPVARVYPEIERWTCKDCKTNDQEFEEVQLDNGTKNVHAVKMIDFYYPSRRYRELYWILIKTIRGKRVEIEVLNRKNKIIANQTGDIEKTGFKYIKQEVNIDANNKIKKGALLKDNVMKWQIWEGGIKGLVNDTNRHPPNYFWDIDGKKWIKWDPNKDQSKLLPK